MILEKQKISFGSSSGPISIKIDRPVDTLSEKGNFQSIKPRRFRENRWVDVHRRDQIYLVILADVYYIIRAS